MNSWPKNTKGCWLERLQHALTSRIENDCITESKKHPKEAPFLMPTDGPWSDWISQSLRSRFDSIPLLMCDSNVTPRHSMSPKSKTSCELTAESVSWEPEYTFLTCCSNLFDPLSCHQIGTAKEYCMCWLSYGFLLYGRVLVKVSLHTSILKHFWRIKSKGLNPRAKFRGATFSASFSVGNETNSRSVFFIAPEDAYCTQIPTLWERTKSF